MRLHRLGITAFGPFAGCEEVDLDALASCGLFLIHGATGAGKTSILDAICFALYAAVPGARAGARARLRSDHAAEGAIPEVTLDFTAAGRRLRVRRSPEFTRPKKRGIGNTTVPARVVLDELVGSVWVNRGTRNDEVALVLKDVLGMGLEQFIKVVLLPQGDFAAFLRASPEERRSVLEKLFDTQRFTDVEAWLAGRRRQSATAAGTARAALSTGLLRVDDVVARLDEGDDIIAPDWSEVLHPSCEPEPGTDPGPDVDTLLGALVAAVDLRASTALAGIEVARSAVSTAESAVHDGTAVSRHQETATAARTRLGALDEQAGAYQDAARRVELSERAGAVSGFVAAVHSATLMREAAQTQIADLREQLTAFVGNDALHDHAAGGDRSEGDGVAGDAVAGDALTRDAGDSDAVMGDLADQGAEATVAGHAADATKVRSLIDLVAGHSDVLQQVVSQAEQAQKRAEESARHREAALIADGESVGFAHQSREAEARRVVAEMSRDAGRAALAETPVLEARHKTLLRIQQLLQDQQRSTGDLETLQGQADSAKLLLLDLREQLLDLRERRLAGLSGELAVGLVAGDSCPVCGSCVHPMPALTTDAVSLADIQSAEADQIGATEALSLLRSKISAETARRDARVLELAEHAGGLGGQPILAATEVLDALAVSAVAIAEAGAQASAMPGAQAEMTAAALEVERLRRLVEGSVAARASSLALATSTLAQSRVAAAEVTTLLANHRAACPCHSGAPTAVTEVTDVGDVTDVRVVIAEMDVTRVVSRHRQTLGHLRALDAGLHELGTLEATVRAAVGRLSVALQANDLDSMAQAEAAVLSPGTVAQLTTLLRTAEQQRAQAHALLAQPGVTAALKLPKPDMDALVEAHRKAAASLSDADRRHTLSEQAQRELRALSGTVRQALADLGPAEQEAQLVQELADCFAGNSADNALRMRLSSYVLSARLAEIATLANERLSTMSDGRYTLEYSDARAAKGARSGLGLLVRDAWTGQPRETTSLSGGEAFMASLALALGMGDAVRAEAGGFDLQTLFVDEGFGSLDEESLEQVMAVLDALREGGRAVGIVSHVTELRTRIPQQLHVLKQQAGSRIQVNVGTTSAA